MKISRALLLLTFLTLGNDCIFPEDPWSIYGNHRPTSETELENRTKYSEQENKGLLGAWIIEGYRLFLSPVDGSSCPYSPTCSRYGEQSFRRYGYMKGSVMTVDRLIRCHPNQRENRYDPPFDFE